MAASTIRKRPANTRRNKSGDTADRIDRRNRVLALRARGLSFREIAKLVGVSHVVCWRDYITLADGEDTILTSELAKEQILAAHAELIGKLMADLDNQAVNGQVEETRNADGELVNSKVRRWISPQTAAEASRTLQRVAVLMGLTEVNPDQGNGSSGQTMNITLVSPAADGAEFQLRAEQLKDAAIDISSTSSSAETTPEVPEPLPAAVDPEPLPTAPTAAPEPIRPSMMTVADRAAARAARKAAAGG